jgi:hypothetical protein
MGDPADAGLSATAFDEKFLKISTNHRRLAQWIKICVIRISGL